MLRRDNDDGESVHVADTMKIGVDSDALEFRRKDGSEQEMDPGLW